MNMVLARVLIILSFVILAGTAPLLAKSTNNATAQQVDKTQLRITNKEVAAVQAELRRRGYYRNTPHGILDAETRDAIQSYQQEAGMLVTGRIDMTLLKSLELKYPATGKEVESARKKGLIPRIGYGAKDAATGTRDATINAGKTVKDKAERATEATIDKTKELATDAGDATVKGAQTVGNKTVDLTVRAGRRANEVFVGRSDDQIQDDIRLVLEADDKTARVRSEVKEGAVKLSTTEGVDLSDAVSRIRNISGVRSVVVAVK